MKNFQKLSLAVVIAASTQYATAGLYIAPGATDQQTHGVSHHEEAEVGHHAKSYKHKEYKQDENYDHPEHHASGSHDANPEAEAVEAVVEIPAEPEVKESFGKYIPIEMAIESLGIPEDWTVNFDQPIEGMEVSWNGGTDWQSVLQKIAQANDVVIAMNVDDKMIGISDNEEVAIGLSNAEPSVWRLVEGRSLRQNLEVWAYKAGHTLAWDASIDYPIEHPAVIQGDIRKALGLVLEAVSKGDKPLSATIHKGNKVIQIVNGGFMSGAK